MIFFNSSRVLEDNVINSVNLVAELWFLTHGAQLIRKNDEQQKSFHTPILIGGDIVGIKHYCKCSSKHIMCECVMLFCRSAAQIFRGDVLWNAVLFALRPVLRVAWLVPPPVLAISQSAISLHMRCKINALRVVAICMLRSKTCSWCAAFFAMQSGEAPPFFYRWRPEEVR